ncbi:unnamed protein product [Cylindrotheca closterium]|uniref:Uncharacterized protein n=1 Tax=Cylindrotheca closterium TaxID=2856 RepID=A0AAD2CVP0_9STRA|nr:unnamed protein product [Cylindrotheca closterium]
MPGFCVSPTTCTVLQGVSRSVNKPAADKQCLMPSSAPGPFTAPRKVTFNDLVRLRRTAFLSRPTQEEFQAVWFTQKEILDRRRKDKRIRYAIARRPETFGTEKLVGLGLYSEVERLQRCNRAIAARASVLSKNKSVGVDRTRGSESDDSSGSLTISYALHSKAASVEAHERALQHSNHIQAMDMGDDASEDDMSQGLAVTTGEAAPQDLLPSVDISSNSYLPHSKLGRALLPKSPCGTIL